MLKSFCAAAAVCLAASVSFAAGLPSRGIHGNYIEARTADVYTGFCFANGEVEQVGREAVFGWKIQDGEWQGVNLAGLGVVGVVRAEHTLGNYTEPVNPAKAVLIVDQRANPAQRAALEAFAKSMGGDLLKDVVKVDYAPIELKVKDGNIHTATAKLTAGVLAGIETRSLNSGDHVCGNEDVYYPPLTKVQHAMPAYTLENTYTGSELGDTWHNRLRRSAFVGTFQVNAQ